jgi:hypothetical protein
MYKHGRYEWSATVIDECDIIKEAAQMMDSTP